MRKFLPIVIPVFLIIIPVFLIFALSVTIFSVVTQTTASKEAGETYSVPIAYAAGNQPLEAQLSDINQVTSYPAQKLTNNGTPPAATLVLQATPTAVQPKAVTVAQERCEFWAIRKWPNNSGKDYLLQRIASTNPFDLDDRQLELWASVLGWVPNCLEYWSRLATTLDLNKRNLDHRSKCYYEMYGRADNLLDEYERKLELPSNTNWRPPLLPGIKTTSTPSSAFTGSL